MFPGTEKKAEAASASVTLANLGAMGSLSVGSKTKSGKWWMMRVQSVPAFCLNLGYTCHTGDVYQDAADTYTNSDSGVKGLKAHIGYWYDTTMKKSRKAYVMAQALFWAVQEGDTGEAKLKDVISKVKSNTGYFSSKTANEMYQNIFENSASFTVKVKEWTYSGSGSHRQKLLQIDSTPIKEDYVSLNDFYRERIRILKVDEDGKPMKNAQFKISAKNIDELYSYKINGTASDADEDIASFDVDTKTDNNGWINLRLTYRLQSDEYYYIEDSSLAAMDAKAKNAKKSEWDEAGIKYASDLSKEGAKNLMEKDVSDQLHSISDTYTITEVNSGNSNIIVNPDYKNGKTITLGEAFTWSRGLGSVEQKEWTEVIEHPYDMEIKDNYKKVKLSVKKQDGYSNDKKAHGEATLEGAVFAVFTDANCTRRAQFVTAEGKQAESEFTTDKDGKFETGYLRCGQTYYIKELKAPEGYKKNDEIKQVTLNGSDYAGDIEYRSEKKNVTIDNQPILGKVKLHKYWSKGETGEIFPEVGAVFQVYLTENKDGRKNTYETCDDYERDTLVIGEDGSATSHDLYYGEYTIHQVSTGGQDTEMVADLPEKVSINEKTDGETQTFSMDNHLFKAYLKIIKKDGNTEQSVLKAGTSYQIYSADGNGKETLVTQEYSDGHRRVKVDTFTTDESGQIMTVERLQSGTYRIHEIGAASGYHIDTPYIEIEINSTADNYTSETDEHGNTYSVVTAEYINEETTGRLSIKKTGEQLADYKDGQFVYEEKQLEGVVFEIYADGDIATQDNQEGSAWFLDGDLVATVTTGEGAVFESQCGGLTGYTVEDGVVTVNLPLGKYHVKEKKTLYGYVLPDTGWDVEFTWQNKDDVYVLNSTDATDENGTINVWNERAKGKLSLKKTDAAASGTAVEAAVFGVYTKDDIYNAAGEKIVDAGTKLGSITTDKEGKAETDFDMPLMSEGYQPETEGAASGSAVSGSAVSGGAITGSKGLNSGDYYFREESVSDSYYLDDTEVPFHLEYKGAETPVIVEKAERTNKQTTVEVDKTAVTGSEELKGCELDITDKDGNVIVTWTSGYGDSVKFTDKDSEYLNLASRMTPEGHLIIGGLKHDTEYVLTERRPADGYVTADSITFKLQESTTEKGKTVAAVKNADGMFAVSGADVIHMVDETTKVRFNKKAKGKLLGGAKIAVYDTNGKKITSFTTKKGKSKLLDGILTAGQTYIFKEVTAPKGYEKAKPIRYTVWDTKAVQTVNMTDKKMGTIKIKTPDGFDEGSHSDTSPKTGYTVLILCLLCLITSAGGFSLYVRRRVRANGKK